MSKTHLVTTLNVGEHKMIITPTKIDRKRKYTAVMVSYRNEGSFSKEELNKMTTKEAMDLCTQVVSLNFKNKDDVNTIISYLICFRDTVYGKTDQQISQECEGDCAACANKRCEDKINEMAKIIDERLIDANNVLGSMNKGMGYWIASELIKHYQPVPMKK